MKVDVRYFASIRERLGPGESVTVEPGRTVAQIRELLIATSPAHAQALSHSRLLRCALNQVLCADSTAVTDGAELAFFPPVTGG